MLKKLLNAALLSQAIPLTILYYILVNISDGIYVVGDAFDDMAHQIYLAIAWSED